MTDAALVLEGGALRSVFSAGVTDVLMERQVEFAYVNGVSAGAMSGMNYIAGQPAGCSDRYGIHQGQAVHELKPRHILRNREIFSFDFVFGS